MLYFLQIELMAAISIATSIKNDFIKSFYAGSSFVTPNADLSAELTTPYNLKCINSSPLRNLYSLL